MQFDKAKVFALLALVLTAPVSMLSMPRFATRRGLVDPNQMINIAVIVLMGYIAIILLSNIQAVSSCDSITNTTLANACNQFFNNAGVLFVLAAVLLLLLVIPLIRGVIGGRGQ